MRSGIYKIINKINKKIYIGSATDLRGRWGRHKFSLKKNDHDNKYLQNSWNKYGEENFEFEVIMFCDREKCIFFEQKCLDIYRPWDRKIGYNILENAGSSLGFKHSLVSIKKIKDNNKASFPETIVKMKEYWNNKESREHQSKKRKEYLSSEINRKELSDSIKLFYKENPHKKLFGDKNFAFGKKYRNRKIERIDRFTGEMKEYESIRDVGKDGFEWSVVGKVCRGKLKTHRGYYWKFS